MDFSVKMELTIDLSLVREIMIEPEIWERASEDGVDQESWYPGTDATTIWLFCIDDDGIIGIILLHVDNSVTLRMHPYLRAQHHQKGRDMMAAFYEWILENTEDRINKINVSIPEDQRKVINFSKRVGFQKEGVDRNSYRKDGKLYGRQNLGITRKQIGEYLSEQRI